MPFFIIRDDITRVKVDAIVNPTNHMMVGTGATDGLVHSVAGPEMDAECERIGGCDTGAVQITGGYNLPAKYVIHTVGPVWKDGHHGEPILLESCYRRSLEAAERLNCESIAFPLISTGTYGYPKNDALRLAEKTIRLFLENSEMTVYLVTYDREVADGKYRGDLSREIARTQGENDPFFQEILNTLRRKNERQEMIPGAGHYGSGERREAPSNYLPNAYPKETISDHTESFQALEDASVDSDFMLGSAIVPSPEDLKEDIRNKVWHLDESFSNMVFRKIEEKGMKTSECYKKANIDRKLFSKIHSNIHYQPSKQTAAAIAVALELDIDEAEELMEKAGFALSGSSKFDTIVRYFIERRIYDVYLINEYLFEFDQQLLGNQLN